MIKLKPVFYACVLAYIFGLIEGKVEIQCVPLRDCQKLWNLVKKMSVSDQAISILRQAQCNFDVHNPKVWCPQVVNASCRTPDGELGNCTPVKECKYFLQLIQSSNGLATDIVNYLQKFQCNDPNLDSSAISVCCPTAQKIIIKKPTTTSEEPFPTPLPLINLPSTEPEVPSDIGKDRPSFLPRPAKGECGIQVIDKIIGGKVTEMDEFPWTALLEYHAGARVRTACAGTLISKKYVVTAAHCTDDDAIRSAGRLNNVILGEFDTSTERDCVNSLGFEDCADPPLKVPVERIILHHEWYTRPRAEINHDIALLRLAKSVRFTDYIKPICLPSSTLTVKEYEKFVVTGWGQTEKGVPSFVKLKTTLPMANRDLCTQKYRDDKKLVVGDGEICVGGEKGKDSCTGDSGGPLMMYSLNGGGTGMWFLIGVVSFGSNQPCGIKDYPALYTYLPKYVDWIYQTVEP